MDPSLRQNDFLSTRKSVPVSAFQQAEIFNRVDLSKYPAEVKLVPDQQTLIADACAETMLTLDLSPCDSLSADEYGKVLFRVTSLLQLAYELQLVEMEDLELQGDRAKAMEKNYQLALDQLEKLQHEKSLHMETPAGELREQVNSLSRTVETLTSHNKQLEEAATVSKKTIQQLTVEKEKLDSKAREQETALQAHHQEVFMLQKQASDLRNEMSRLCAAQPAAISHSEGIVSQQAFLSQMDDLETAYQKQLSDLEAQLDGVKAENLTLCMELQDVGQQAQKTAQKNSQLEDNIRIAEHAQHHLKAEETSLREELKSQILLLSEFEQRFEQQVSESTQQIEALRQQLEQTQSRTRQVPVTVGHSDDTEQLAETDQTVKILAAEKIQLLEAYELLESDTGRLIDDAVKAHRIQVDDLEQQLKVKVEELQALSKEGADMKISLCDLEAELAIAHKDLREVLSGDLQLGSALAEIKSLRAQLSKTQGVQLQATAAKNELADTAEFYFEESKRLRHKYEPGTSPDIYRWRQQRQSKLAEVEALNVELERMVSALEQDRTRGSDSQCLRHMHAQRTSMEPGQHPKELSETDMIVKTSEMSRPDLWDTESALMPRPSVEHESQMQIAIAVAGLHHFARVVLEGHEQVAAHHKPIFEPVLRLARDVSSGVQLVNLYMAGDATCDDVGCPGAQEATSPVGSPISAALGPASIPVTTSDMSKMAMDRGHATAQQERLKRAGQIIASLQAALRLKDRELSRLQVLVTDSGIIGRAMKESTSGDLTDQSQPCAQTEPVPASGSTVDMDANLDPRAELDTARLQPGLCTQSRVVKALARATEETRVLKQAVKETASICTSYHTQLQTVLDQRNILYRDYAAMAGQMRARALADDSQKIKLLDEIGNSNAAIAVLEAKLGHFKHSEQQEAASVHAVVLRCKLERTSRELAKCREEQSCAQRQMEGLSWKCRELHVACQARCRVLVSVNLDLEHRLMWQHHRLLQTVPAATYFKLLERHTSLLHDRCTDNTLVDLMQRYPKPGCNDVDATSTLQQERQNMSETAACDHRDCHPHQVMSRNQTSQSLHQDAEGREQLRINQKAYLPATDADRARLTEDLARSQACINDLQKFLTSEATKLKAAQLDAMAARQALIGTLPAHRVQAIQKQLEATHAQAVAAQQELDKQRTGSFLCEHIEEMYKTEISKALAELSEVKQERDRLKDRVQMMQTRSCHDGAAVLKAVLVEKEWDLRCMSQVLCRAKADASWITQGLQQSQSENGTLQAQLDAISCSGKLQILLHEVIADTLLMAQDNTVSLLEQLGLAVADRVPVWDTYLLSTKLYSSMAVNDAISSINTALSMDLVTENKMEMGTGPETIANVHAHSACLFSSGLSPPDRELEVQYRLCKRKNRLLARAADSFARMKSDLQQRVEYLELCSIQIEEEHAQQRSAQKAYTLEFTSKLNALHGKIFLLSKNTDDNTKGLSMKTHSQPPDVANIHKFTPSSGAHPWLDSSLALQYIDSIKHLRTEVAERERECADATRLAQQSQAQYQLVSEAHDELLQRMNSFVHPFASEFESKAQGDGIQGQVAAAEKVMQDQADMLKLHEKNMDVLSCALSSAQDTHNQREQELTSRIAALEVQLANQLTSWKDYASQPIPDGITSVDEMILTISDLKADLESSREDLKRKELLWEDERKVHTGNDWVRSKTEPTPYHSHASGTRPAELKLREALTKKDKLIMALRDAIKQLETKLIESGKKHADSSIQNSSDKKIDKLAHIVNSLRKDKELLEITLDAERSRSSALRSQLADAVKEKIEIKNTLMKANEQTRDVLAELSTAQTYIGTLQHSMEAGSAVDVHLKNSKAEKEISKLKTRIHVLEEQKTKFKSAPHASAFVDSMPNIRTTPTTTTSTPSVADLKGSGQFCLTGLAILNHHKL
eukprot:jgi/Ulvmu1/5941/UM026_0063.1